MRLTVGVMGSADVNAPSDAFELIVYTGSGRMGREMTNICSTDTVVLLGGCSDALEGTGGITARLPGLVASFDKETGANLVYDSDPDDLMSRLMDAYTSQHYKHPSCFCEEMVGAAG